MKRHFKRISSIFLVAVMLLAVIAVVVGCAPKKKSASNELADAFEKTLTAITPYQSAFLFDEKEAYKGTLTLDGNDISLSMTQAGATMDMGKIFEGMLLSMSFASDSSVSFVNLLAKIAGESILDADFYVKGNEIAISEGSVLGEGFFGTDYSKLSEKLGDSALGQLGGITEDDLNEVFATDVVYSGDDLIYMSEKFAAILSSELKANGAIKVSNEDITVAGEQIKAKVYKLELTPEVTAIILKSAVTKFFDDKKASSIVEAAYNATMTNEDKAFSESLAEMLGELDESLEDLKKTEFNVNASCAISGGYLVTAMVDAVYEGEKYYVEACFGADPSTTKEISVSAVIDGQTMAMIWNIEENTASRYEGKLSMKMGSGGLDVKFDLFSYSIDKQSGDFEIDADFSAIADGDYKFNLKGSLVTTTNSLTFTLTSASLTMPEIKYDVTLGVEFKLEKTEEKPTMPEYKDILDLTKEELTEIATNAEAFAHSIMEMFGIGGEAMPE